MSFLQKLNMPFIPHIQNKNGITTYCIWVCATTGFNKNHYDSVFQYTYVSVCVSHKDITYEHVPRFTLASISNLSKCPFTSISICCLLISSSLVRLSGSLWPSYIILQHVYIRALAKHIHTLKLVLVYTYICTYFNG